MEVRNVKVVTFNDWERIDAAEKRMGSLKNKPREKVSTWKELLQAVSE